VYVFHTVVYNTYFVYLDRYSRNHDSAQRRNNITILTNETCWKRLGGHVTHRKRKIPGPGPVPDYLLLTSHWLNGIR